MIQEKDFLYRVPVKTAPITTPGGQIRNPEILVDIEGGEFMHGNILDANSTNKLVNQSVKDAVDKNIADGSFVTKDLLDKEVDRATSAESDLQAAIDTKADAIALSNYVLTTALNQQVDTLNTAINAKQDAGNYIPYDSTNTSKYKIDKDIRFENEQGYTQIGFGNIFYSDTEGINRFSINPQSITFGCNLGCFNINPAGISLLRDGNATVNISHSRFSNKYFDISGDYIKIGESGNRVVEINNSGIKFNGKTASDIPTANGSFIDISNYATRDFVTAGLSTKQNKITVNTIDVTDIETADVTKLRTIVTNLINALISSGLINATSGVE